ncbi:MAG: hypothetical protein KW788_05175 [Candidatus Doudnabacteria bacterium]|nr:hypothetical protein [Candidatus Doudnabacteria bacterium]
MYGESEYNFDKYSGAEKDELNEDAEDDGIDAEDRAEDILNAVDEASGKLTTEQIEAFGEVVDTIDTHYDDDPKEAKKLFDKALELLEEIKSGDTEERIEREEEFNDKIEALNKAGMNLGKK